MDGTTSKMEIYDGKKRCDGVEKRSMTGWQDIDWSNAKSFTRFRVRLWLNLGSVTDVGIAMVEQHTKIVTRVRRLRHSL